MAKMYYDKDCNLGLLKGKKIAVIGYGSQGHAQAQNLRDSGLDVVVGLPAAFTEERQKVINDGLTVVDTEEAAKIGDLVMRLVPDQIQPAVYEKSIRDNLKEGNVLLFSHGFNIHFNQIVPPPYVDVTMIAPKGPGHTVRSQY